jgi:BMFP domain-containing protein YqiC
METKWSVLAALRAGREEVRRGASDGALGAIRALRGEVPAPVRDQAYYALMDTALRTGGEPSMAILARPRDETLALFDATIVQLAARLH